MVWRFVWGFLFLTVISALLSMKNHYVSKVKNKPPDMLILVSNINKGVTARRGEVIKILQTLFVDNYR